MTSVNWRTQDNTALNPHPELTRTLREIEAGQCDRSRCPDIMTIATGVMNAVPFRTTTKFVADQPNPVESGVPGHRDRAEKLQVVIGLFDEPSSLATALQDLLSLGFVVANICVSGTRDTVSMAGSIIQNNQDVDPLLMSLFLHTELYDTKEESQTIVGSQGTLFVQLNSMIKQRQANTVDVVGDDCPKFTAEIYAQIDKGRLVLVVETDQPLQLIHASRVMLRHSFNAVQTHEFRSGPNC